MGSSVRYRVEATMCVGSGGHSLYRWFAHLSLTTSFCDWGVLEVLKWRWELPS